MRIHIQRCKGRFDYDGNSSAARNASRIEEDGLGAAGPSINNVTGCKKKRVQMSASKAAVFPVSGDMGGSLIDNLKEARPDDR